jgi:pre-mRNA-splicing factor 38A
MDLSCIRWTLEAAGQLEPRRSALEDEEEEEEEKEEEEAAVNDLEAMDIDKVHFLLSLCFSKERYRMN